MNHTHPSSPSIFIDRRRFRNSNISFIMPINMKRKEVDQVSQDFSDFSLSSPATKIRRLNAELPPIVEEDEPDVAFFYQQQQSTTPVIEELPSPPDNQEKTLVLFKPIHQHLLVSPSTFSFTVDSDIVSGIKKQLPWSRHSESMPSTKEEEVVCRDKNSDRLAVVPWAPSQFLPAEPNAYVSNTEPTTEFMEAEQMEEEASMDIEIEQDNCNTITNSSVNQALHGELKEMEGLHPWQQQHCLLPQLPQNTSTPISWTR